MIIECINCSKKFDVNSELIPSEGRTIQCGSCNHIWFFKKQNLLPPDISKVQVEKKPVDIVDNVRQPDKYIKEEKINITTKNKSKKNFKIKGSEIIKYNAVSSFTFSNFLSYIIVMIISFVGLIILIDTFKFQLYDFFPELEFLLYSFYETLKDIQLFIKDLT